MPFKKGGPGFPGPHPPQCGFQPGHAPFWTKGNPGNRHSKFTGAPGQGFQRGHRPYYTGGSVKGHAPTNRNPPPIKADPRYSFAAPLGSINQAKGQRMGKAKSKERECLEAIQNGRKDAELVVPAGRFPPGMVARLRALHDVAEDSAHRDFMHAQRMVSDILTHQRGGKKGEEDGGDGAPADGFTVRVVHGHATTPLPGAAEEKPPPAGGT